MISPEAMLWIYPPPAKACDTHCRIDVELKFVGAAIEHVTLEVRRNIESERVGSLIHAPIHFARRDQLGPQETGRIESAGNARRELRLIFIDDGNRRPVQGLRRNGRLIVDREREHEKYQEHHDAVARQAAQFLDPELRDVGEAHLRSPASSGAGWPTRARPRP